MKEAVALTHRTAVHAGREPLVDAVGNDLNTLRGDAEIVDKLPS